MIIRVLVALGEEQQICWGQLLSGQRSTPYRTRANRKPS
jgi:hypothetical protein